jgi:MFS family permease
MGRDFGRLWAASAVSNIGDGIALAAFPLLAAAFSRDPAAVAGLTFAFTAPWLVFGLPAGALADRFDRRLLMVSVDTARAAGVVALAAAVLTDTAGLTALYAAAFFLGSAETLFANASGSILPALVPQDRLEEANGRLGASASVANEFVGPPVGGLLFGVAVALPFFVDAGSFAVAALLVAAMRGRFRPERLRTTLRADVIEGVRFVAGHSTLRLLLAAVAVLAVVDAAWYSILVLYAQEILGLGAVGFSLLLVAGGAGTVLGSLGAGRLRRRIGTRQALAAALLVAGAAQLALGLISSPGIAAAMVAAGNLAFGVWNVLALSLRQRLAPDALLGRVHSAYRFVGAGAYAVGALAGGSAAAALGLRAPFLLGAPVLVVLAALSATAAGRRRS